MKLRQWIRLKMSAGAMDYEGKQFSLLGDSISTLEGYHPENYRVFYTGENARRAKVFRRKDTWWGQVIDFFGGKLLVNNSWSGSRVTKLPDHDRLFPSGCSDERTFGLHINNVMPDVILVFLGTNDWANGVKLGDEAFALGKEEEQFEYAYFKMLSKLKENYPDAKIWCCTLNTTFISQNPGFCFPYEYAGIHIDIYNNIIRNITQRLGCEMIDFAKYKKAYDSIDGSHPNANGMITLSKMAICEMTHARDITFDSFKKFRRMQH